MSEISKEELTDIAKLIIGTYFKPLSAYEEKELMDCLQHEYQTLIVPPLEIEPTTALFTGGCF